MVTRTYRAAIRVGEDYITIEETISLPPTASDSDIAQAVDTGLRIYRAQQAAIESQMQAIRELHPSGPVRILDPESPASDKQRSYLEYLIATLNVSDEQMQRTLREHSASYETLTKGAASEIIDQLKQQLDQRGTAEVAETAVGAAPGSEQVPLTEAVATRTPTGNPASTRQIAALQRVAAQHGIDLADELRSRFGTATVEELSSAEAGALLQELQSRR